MHNDNSGAAAGKIRERNGHSAGVSRISVKQGIFKKKDKRDVADAEADADDAVQNV